MGYEQIVGLFAPIAGIAQAEFFAHRVARDVRLLALKVANQLLEALCIFDLRRFEIPQELDRPVNAAKPEQGEELGQHLIAGLAAFESHTQERAALILQMRPVQNELQGVEPRKHGEDRLTQTALTIDKEEQIVL